MLCIDPVGKYRLTIKKGSRKYAMENKMIKMKAATMIDSVTGSIKIHSIQESMADLVTNQVE